MPSTHSRSGFSVWIAVRSGLGVMAIGVLTAACQQWVTLNPLVVLEPSPSERVVPTTVASLKLGALLPYTGNLATSGQAMIETLPLLVDMVNACGGVNDADVQLIVEDDRSTAAGAETAITKLIQQDQVDLVLVGFLNSDAVSVVETAVDHQLPILSPASTSPVLTERANSGEFEGFWARTAPSDVNQARALAELALSRDLRTVSLVVTDNEDGRSFETAFISAFESLGGIVINRDFPVRYDPNASYLGFEALDAFRPAGIRPDAVIGALDPRGGALLLRAASELGVINNTQLMLTDNIQPDAFRDQVGYNADGRYILSRAIGIVPGAAGSALDNFTTLWKETKGRSPDMFVPQTWDAGALLLLAAAAAGSNDGAAIKEQLQQVANPPGVEVTDVCTGLKLLKTSQDINYQGASGTVDLDENGDVMGNYNVWTINDQGNVEVLSQINLDQ